jgi:hypothetical protein
MEKKYTNMERRGLPGGPNEMFTYVTGVFSTEGYRKDSPDVNNLFNVISSNSISMLENDGTPLKKGPIIGIDNLGNKKIMYPGGEYKFEGDEVLEIPMAQDAGEFRRLPAKYLKSHGKRIDDEYQMEGFEKAVNQDLDSLLKGWNTDGYDSHWYDGEAGENYGVTSDQLRTFASKNRPKSFVNAAAYSHAMNKLANDAGGKNVINIPFADNPIFMRTADDDIEYVEYKKPTTLQEDGYIDETGTNAVNQDQSFSTGLAKRYTLYGEGGEELPKAQNGIGDLIKFQETLKKPTTTTAVKKEPVANSQAAQFAKNYNEDIRKVNQAHKDAGTKPLELTPEMTKEIQKQDLKDLWNFAFEFTGLPATARIYSNLRNDPIQFSKDVGNTLLDASTIVPELLYEGSNYLFGDGTFDLSDKTNVLGNPYGSGLNAASDLLIAAPLFRGVGKFGKLTAKSFKPGFYPKPTKGLTSGAKTFKSEINWGNWNKDIPNNKSLMDEYLAIEESTKASGTWMKNPDGSAFKGTPEQFVQQQSQNFKKAFPNPVVDDAGNIQINYHGSGAKFNIFDPSKFYSGQFGKGVYTSPHKDKIIKSYANPSKNRTQKMVSKNNGDKPTSNLYELYINSKNPGNYDDIVDNSVSYIGDIRNYGKTADDFPTLAEWKNTNKEFLKQNAYLKTDEDILNFLNNQSIYNKGSNVRENFRPVLPEYDFLSIPSTPFKEGVTPFSNIMKSAVGNDGMFDMTNPDIYKALLPFIFGTGLASQKKGGEQLPKAQKRKFKPGGAYGPGDGLKRFFRKNNIQTSLGFGNTAPHLNNYVPKVGINTIMGRPRKGFLDLGLTAGGDKKGFAGNLDATYYGPFMHGNRHFQGLIDSDTYYDQGTVGSSISGGGNWIGGSRNIGNKRKDGLRKGDWSTEGGIGLQIGAYKDLNAAPTSYYETQTTGGAPVLKYKPAPMGIDFGPKAHFRLQKAFGNNLTLDAKASIVADLVKNSVEGAAEGNQAQYAYEYIDNPDAPNYTNANQQIQSGNSILANEAVEDRFRPEFKPSAEVKLTYNIPTSGSLFGGRKRGKTPDELDEEISVKERKPKPEKEPKPKKEPKPIEVDEWARHPRWLQYGGEELDLGNINPNSRYGKWLTEKVSSGKYTYDSKLNKLMPKAQPGIETKTNSLDPLDIKSRISNMIEGKTQEQAASEAEAARIKEAAEAERAKLKEAIEAKLFKPEVKPEDPDKTSIGYYGDTFYLADNRKINAASGEPIVPTRDLFGGRYSRDVAEDIIKTSKNAKQDPYTMLAIALQETLLGKNDNNLGHIKDPMSDSMPEDYIYFFQNKQDELRNNEDFDYDNLSELLKIQAYNGLGTVYPHTEEDYHGHAMDYIYGVPLTGEGINMKENPLYGKRIIDLRDNVLKNNEAIKFLVDKYYNEDGGETDLYKVYSDFINGVYDDTNDYIRAEGIYDKLNRVHYKEAKESGMSIPNYIMTNVIKS